MIEFNFNSLLWLCIGAGSTLTIMLILGLCAVSGRCSRMEERLNTQLKVEKLENNTGKIGNDRKGIQKIIIKSNSGNKKGPIRK